MLVVRGHLHAPGWAGAAVAIGNFDGVHVGHRALIARAKALAAAAGAGTQTVALTFDPHPSAVLAPAAPREQIASLARRLELLGEAGADAVVIEPFTRELASLAPAAFVDEIVLGALRARAIVVGYDFKYGQGGAGTPDALREHGARAGIAVDVVAPVQAGGEVASSTRVRAHLRAGELAAAERLLGRRWDVDGIVVHGAHRGRAIGIPTANIQPDSALTIAPGIYAVTLQLAGEAPRPAVASLGTNPTFVAGDALVLEVHVLDFAGDLYDRRVRVAFAARLRDEAKFDSVEALVAQIERDIAAARVALA
ncbi:MAG TPA: bifunctional riboflavin kinase/FAD synthetase [Kofleriaceae bacterium]|nr:bifunctional riboflavin kinase/FAD synthetase [Kofleriaceae bacterium]